MEYRVLARKYRPATFGDLIGQEAMVRTLTNAIASGRIAHAFLLTGIRGIGKTTTARIIARALNCEKGPTASPCGDCEHCRMIAEDRHVDVLEMDAASHTGVDDIRSLIDTVRYLPASGRYKIYIIDEVHMLSGSAFNALLKTLEEPPPHVKFIFATTESRKIPVTVLSRCQRFDLKRIGAEMLAEHLGKVAAKENISVEPEALKLIALVAEGSVRDALSLLDQAGAHAAKGEAVTAAAIRQMIGSADNTATFSMLDLLLKGDTASALRQAGERYASGSDPLWMVQDAMEAVHLITRIKVSPAALADVSLSPHDREAAKTFADALSMPVLARLWQMLMKGIGEVRLSPVPMAALEMLLVRIAYAAELPTPAEVIRTAPESDGAGKPAAKPNLALVSAAAPKAQAGSFAEAVALFEKYREPLLYSRLKQEARLVAFTPGRIDLRMPTRQPRDFTARLSECLTQWTGQAWQVTLSEQEGEPSLADQEAALKEKQVQQAAAHPLVASALEQFPGAKLVGVKHNPA